MEQTHRVRNSHRPRRPWLPLLAALGAFASHPASAAIVDVPADQPDIRAAVAAAANGDTIVIAPGTHTGGAFIQNKVLTIASRYLLTGDTTFVAQTVLNGIASNACGGASGCAGNAVLEFGTNAHGSAIVGLTLQNGENGSASMSIVDVLHCRVLSNGDGVDFVVGSGGTISDNLFADNVDDGIDLNGRMNITITNNLIRNNRDDGIEFRLYDFSGTTATTVIADNRISGNGEDGIQIIDYSGSSPYVLRVERNVFSANFDAGGNSAAIGIMPNGETIESLVGAPMSERLYVIHNTFMGEMNGLVGGANVIALNNIFTGTQGSAVRRVSGGSIASYTMFWANGIDHETSVVDLPHLMNANPALNADGTLTAGSPAIDAGTAFFQWNGETVLDEPPGAYLGNAPDLGAVEFASGGPVNHAPTVSAGVNVTVTLPAQATLAGAVSDDGLPGPPAALTSHWSVVSGAGPMVIHEPELLQTQASFSLPGSYVVRLTASDGGLSGSDVVAITVLPSSNAAPTVHAGPDQTITLPSDVVLDGSVTDDGLPGPPAAVATSWVMDTGPGAVTFESPGLADTRASFSAPGIYSLVLIASDGALTSRDWVQVTVLPEPNTAPVVDAGPPQTVQLPADALLDGTVSDDGRPLTPGVVTTTWLLLSGPASVTIEDPGLVDTWVTFTAAGTYVFRLSAFDGARTTTATTQVTVLAPANTAPQVDAGFPQTITLPASATLFAWVSDDGFPNPPASVSLAWSKGSGPGTVTFGDPGGASTTASFSAAGAYVLRLTASDGALATADSVQITVQPQPPPIDRRVAAASDDTEEETASGTISANTTDIELVTGTTPQIDGLRFANITVPRGAVILNAYIQFEADEVQSEVTNLTFHGQAADNAPTFTTVARNVSSRPRTVASVSWSPAPWTVVGEAGPNQRTGDIKAIIQEIVDRPGWVSGNAIAIIVSGTGHRTARAFETDPTGAALLHIESGGVPPPPNSAPVVNAGIDQTITLPASAPLFGTVSDDGLPDPPATVAVTWSKVSGHGIVTFGNPFAPSTTASFSIAGTYVLRMTANDGVLAASDSVQVTVLPSPNVAPTVDAGSNQTITLPASASLSGVVSDDGLPNPPGAVTVTWSKGSGPGLVTFGNVSAASTTVSFSMAGTYVLRLAASDGALAATDSVQITVLPVPNVAPVVDAGPNQTITLPASASLSGTVSDDGLPNPPGALTVAWSAVSGPGPVTFQSPNQLSTNATFTTAGVYQLRLGVTDGALSAADTVRITVLQGAAPLERRIAASSDDAEESASGSVNYTSTNLQLVFNATNQIDGLRFTNLTIPNGAVITTAYVQFTAQLNESGATSLVIRGQAADNAATFTGSNFNISSRSRTADSVSWAPPAWTTGAAGAAQRTPELKGVIQEIVSRPGWASGNGLVLIVQGTGVRTAYAYDGGAAQAALLHVEYAAGGAAELAAVDDTSGTRGGPANPGSIGSETLPGGESGITDGDAAGGEANGTANAVVRGTTDGAPAVHSIAAALDELPRELALRVLGPSPARGAVMVECALPGHQPSTLELHDIAGRCVATRELGSLGAGRHAVALGGRLPAGVYVARLTQAGRARIVKVALLP